jgi:outer membrane lipoprotein-sorting protein
MLLKHIILLLAFILLVSSSLEAKAKSKSRSFLPKSFTAKLEQVYVSPITGKEKKSDANLDYQFPGSFKFISHDPKNQLTFVSNKETTWLYNPPFMEGEPGQLTINKSGKNVITTFFDSLSRGLVNNALYSVKNAERARKIKFKKKKVKQIGLVGATLNFKSNIAIFKDLISVDLIYPDKKVKLNLSNLKTGVKFSKEHFIFVAPKNTKTN